MYRYIAVLWSVALALLLVPLAAQGQDATDANIGTVEPFYGSFSARVPIRVPKFHGLEPKLSLAYNSTNGGGWLGVGWTLGGTSYIHRVSPGKGAPRFDANDIYVLDGMELAPCTVLGGTHCTRIQNYQRIQWDAPSNRWLVWATNGNLATYTSVFTTSGHTYRWALSEVRDPRGNAVNYTYWCDGSNDCYLDQIAYSGAVVKFYRESRPDPVSYAIGGQLAKTAYRLMTITVKVGSNLARAYKLGYQQSQVIGRSRLASVQQFGRDAVVNANGIISGGTSLPARTFDWYGDVEQVGSILTTGFVCPSANLLLGDFNGDGKTDLLCSTGSSTYDKVGLSNGDGTFAVKQPGAFVCETRQTGDFNGDGKTDVFCHRPSTGTNDVALSNGDGTFARTSWVGCASAGTSDHVLVQTGDFNGDGKSDLLCHHVETGINDVALSNGDGTFVSGSWVAWCGGAGVQTGDFNGDGKADLLCHLSSNGNTWVALSNGNGTFTSIQWSNWCINGSGGNAWVYPGDFNGDGKTDLLCDYTGNGDTYVALSFGNGNFASIQTPAFCTSAAGHTAGSLYIGDFNGDGRTDLLCWDGYSGNTSVEFSRGDGTFETVQRSAFPPGGTTARVGDFNGDGKADLLDSVYAHAQLSNGPPSLLLFSVANGIGGQTGVFYTPSSSWPNASDSPVNLPVGLALQTVSTVTVADGRGVAATTDYKYAGARWSYGERRFLGFREVTAVLDAAGNYTETWYHQGEGCHTKPEASYYYDPQGNKFRYTLFEYIDGGAAPGPFTSLLSSRRDFECNRTISCRESRQDFSYDQYANVTEIDEYGDVAAGHEDDDRITVREHAYDTGAYIVDRLISEKRYGPTGPRMSERQLSYDSFGSPTQIRDWDSESNGFATTTFTYDSVGNLTSETTPRNATTRYVYDPTYHLFLTQTTDALLHIPSRTWDAVIEATLTLTDVNNQTTTYSYDPLGRPATVTQPDGTVTRMDYLNLGNPNTQKIRTTQAYGAAEALWSDVYQDGLGRMYKTVKQGNLTKQFVYSDGSDRKWKESLWYTAGTPSWVTFEYDGAKRLTKVTNPDGTYSEITYGVGSQITYDELRNQKIVFKDPYGRVTRVTRTGPGALSTATFQYDALDHLSQMVDGVGNTSTYQWSSLGRKLQNCDRDLGCWSFTHDAGGLVTSEIDAKGAQVTYTYDVLGRLKTKTPAGGVGTIWAYDQTDAQHANIGRLTHVYYPGGDESHSWNARGLETSTTRCVESTCKRIDQTYDRLGQIKTVTYPDSETVTYTYDSVGRLNALSGSISNISWTAAGQIGTLAYANGTTANYTYDPTREWLTAAEVKKGTKKLVSLGYGYNAAGLVTGMSSSTDPTSDNLSFTYDGLKQLIGVSGGQSQTFGYDSLGDLLWNSAIGNYTYDDANHVHAVTQAADRGYSYDPNGNLLVETLRVADGCGRPTTVTQRQLTWDTDHRLASVTMRSGVTNWFLYDADGQRIRKSGPTSTIGRKYFGPFVETDLDGNDLVKYYYAGPILVARKDATGTYWYHQDRLNSVRLLTDASGTVKDRYDYAAFGDPVVVTGTLSNDRNFTGQRRDSQTQLLYMTARYYDPQVARFLSPDSVIPDPANPLALNRYAYGYNNPVSNVDPTGHSPEDSQFLFWSWNGGSNWGGINIGIGIGIDFPSPVFSPPVWEQRVPVVGANTSLAGSPLGNSASSSVGTLASPLSPLDPGVDLAMGYKAPGLSSDQLGEAHGPTPDWHDLYKFVDDLTVVGSMMGLPVAPFVDSLEWGGAAITASVNAALGVREGASAFELGTSGARSFVLGHFPFYLQTAQKLGASYFALGRVGRWLPESVVWFLDRRALDLAIARGDEFALATDLTKAGSFYGKEVFYLMQKGYQYSADGLRLIPAY